MLIDSTCVRAGKRSVLSEEISMYNPCPLQRKDLPAVAYESVVEISAEDVRSCCQLIGAAQDARHMIFCHIGP